MVWGMILGDTAAIIQSLKERHVQMTSKLAVQRTISDRLMDQVHEFRQYSLRTNLLIYSIEEEENTEVLKRLPTSTVYLNIIACLSSFYSAPLLLEKFHHGSLYYYYFFSMISK